MADATLKICEYYKLDPLKLISSGCMIMTCQDGDGLARELERNNIKATVIGKITKEPARILVDKERREEIGQPESDELYKAVG